MIKIKKIGKDLQELRVSERVEVLKYKQSLEVSIDFILTASTLMRNVGENETAEELEIIAEDIKAVSNFYD